MVKTHSENLHKPLNSYVSIIVSEYGRPRNYALGLCRPRQKLSGIQRPRQRPQNRDGDRETKSKTRDGSPIREESKKRFEEKDGKRP